MKKILVTGAAGQLGNEIKLLSALQQGSSFHFADRAGLDVTDETAVHKLIGGGDYSSVISCAAYTAVDKAESEKDLAFKINAEAAGYVAAACKATDTKLIHISTDFVFDGTIARPLLESDAVNPLSVYGHSKLEGEKTTLANNPDAVVLRTAWLYSSFGNNFVKTIIRLCKEKEQLNIIYDQVGSPTYARDLAAVVLQILNTDKWAPGIYHYSNEGVASWYDFAIAIRDLTGLKTPIYPIETTQYPTPATRPKYSLLNKAKIKSVYGIKIPYWRDSLQECMQLLK